MDGPEELEASAEPEEFAELRVPAEFAEPPEPEPPESGPLEPEPPLPRLPNSPLNSDAPAPAAFSAKPLTSPTNGSEVRFHESW